MKKTPWYEFWNPQSGFFGGVIMGLVIWIAVEILLAMFS